MGTTAGSAAASYAPAMAAVNKRESQAEDLASRSTPQTYTPDISGIIGSTSLLSKLKTLSDQSALHELHPDVATGQNQAISGIAGGVEADNQMLRNNAIKSGLEQAVTTGARVDGPASVGGVTVANVYGRELLDYENQRRAQQMQLAQGLTPSTMPDAGELVSAQENAKQSAIGARNNWTQYLNQLRFNSVNNMNNQTQQSEAIEQQRLNANAANNSAMVSAGIQAAGSMAGSAM